MLGGRGAAIVGTETTKKGRWGRVEWGEKVRLRFCRSDLLSVMSRYAPGNIFAVAYSF